MWIPWLIVAGLCFVIEIYTAGFFIFWFGIGALLALVVSLFTNNLFIQAIVFIVSSTLCLLLTKPLMKRFNKSTKTTPTNVYSIIGKEGFVIEDINAINSSGKIKVNGEIWSATSESDIEKDSKIRVKSINGVKAEVEKVES